MKSRPPGRTLTWLLPVALLLAGCPDNPIGSGTDVGVDSDAGLDLRVRDATDRVDAERDVGDTTPDSGPDALVELEADPGPGVFATVGEEVVLDGSSSAGAATYQWDFGDGEAQSEPSDAPTALHTYTEPGRYQAVLTVFDDAGDRDAASTVATITDPVVFEPKRSTTVTAYADDRAAVVSRDSDELMLARLGPDRWVVDTRVAIDRKPRTVAAWQGWLVVPCEEDATVLFLPQDAPEEVERVALPAASRPYGVATVDDGLFVTLQATGRVARIELEDGVPQVADTAEVIDDARGIAALPDGRLLVSRWRSPDDQGEIAVVSADLQTVDVWPLAFDPQAASDTEVGGVPTYLGPVAVSPTGREAAVPSLQANVDHGEFLNGEELTHETTIRGIASFLDLDAEAEQFARRKQWDDRGFAHDAVFSSRGDFLYVAMRGNRAVERYDVLASTESGTLLEVGHTIEGLALTPDDRYLLVDAMLSRELVVYETAEFGRNPEPLARLPIPTAEPLDPQLLRGKVLFNDAQDPRLTKDGYIACAHCHLEGESDHRVWDFTDRGEGLRNTTSLLGRAGTGDGPVHWSANFDEIQDFENDIRFAFAGTGLMEDADFQAGTRSEPLGDPKAGVSEDLDALAAYVSSLDRHLPSPHRNEDGTLTAEAATGEALFTMLGCDSCHAPPNYTDSGFIAPATPILHDVGTLGPGSGERLGEPLTGIDTPTLRGVWASPPYLHDGSAATLRAVLTTANPDDEHGATSSLTDGELDALVAFLRSLDHR